MGIKNAKTICRKLLMQSSVFKIKENTNNKKYAVSGFTSLPTSTNTASNGTNLIPDKTALDLNKNRTDFKIKFKNVNVYVDGPLWVFSSIPKNESDITRIVKYMIEKLKNRLINFLLYRVNKILSVTIHFDGKAPPMKFFTQCQRKSYDTRSINMSDIFKLFKQQLKQIGTLTTIMRGKSIVTPIIVAEHKLGESEHFIYSERDKTIPSILYTRDSDIFMVAYNHAKENDNDEVCLMWDNEFYDLSKFKCPLYVGPFRMLLILCGTDFNRNIFTQTMAVSVLNAICSNDSPAIKNLVEKLNNCTNIVNIVGYFLEILLVNHLKNVTFTPNRSSIKKATTAHDDVNILPAKKIKTSYDYVANLNKLQWIWEYFTEGVHYKDYQNQTLVDIEINTNLLLKDILIQHFNLDSKEYENNNFKEILNKLKKDQQSLLYYR